MNEAYGSQSSQSYLLFKIQDVCSDKPAVINRSYHQLTRENFLIKAGKHRESFKELHNALLLLQRRILLECLQDQFPELLWLSPKRKQELVTDQSQTEHENNQPTSIKVHFTFILLINSCGKNNSRPTSFLRKRNIMNAINSIAFSHFVISSHTDSDRSMRCQVFSGLTYSSSSKLDFFSNPLAFISL